MNLKLGAGVRGQGLSDELSFESSLEADSSLELLSLESDSSLDSLLPSLSPESRESTNETSLVSTV